MLSSSTRPRSLPLSAWAAHALDNENLSVDASNRRKPRRRGAVDKTEQRPGETSAAQATVAASAFPHSTGSRKRPQATPTQKPLRPLGGAGRVTVLQPPI
jgi:hypothetical protein